MGGLGEICRFLCSMKSCKALHRGTGFLLDSRTCSGYSLWNQRAEKLSPAVQERTSCSPLATPSVHREGTSMCVLVTQSYPTLCDPNSLSPPGSSVYGILQARTLQWIAIPFSRGISQSRGRILVSCIAGRFFTILATSAAMQTNTPGLATLKVLLRKLRLISSDLKAKQGWAWLVLGWEKTKIRTFLGIQWLRLLISTAEGESSIPKN